MQMKTVLHRVHEIKGFGYGKVRFAGDQIEVDVRPRQGSRPICSGCGQPGPGYDTLWERHFRFVPRWAIGVVLVYAMRRVDCPCCGVTVVYQLHAGCRRRLWVGQDRTTKTLLRFFKMLGEDTQLIPTWLVAEL